MGTQKLYSPAPRSQAYKNKRVVSEGSAYVDGELGAKRVFEDGTYEIAFYDMRKKDWTVWVYPIPLKEQKDW